MRYKSNTVNNFRWRWGHVVPSRRVPPIVSSVSWIVIKAAGVFDKK